MASASTERQLALEILVRVEGGAFASRLLERVAAPGVRTRVLGVLRWLSPLDRAVARFTRQPLDALEPEVRAVLRLGLYDAVHLGVPAPVAVDTAVALIRRAGRPGAAGLVNAVLRRAVEQWPEIVAAAPIWVQLSHPRWLYRRWCELYGEATALAIMKANQEPAELWAWLLDESARVRLTGREVALEDHPWCPGAVAAPGNAGALIAEVLNGSAYAQDPSSQLVAHVAARLGGVGGSLADLCAAPGGKAALASTLTDWRRLVALDIRLLRVRLVADLLGRSVTSGTVAVADAAAAPLRPDWDVVLLDAPCSASGTLRRHPEVRWRLRPQALPALARTQRRLLEGAAGLVAPGGRLLYATCSVEPEENEDLIDRPPRGLRSEEIAPYLPPGVPVLPTRHGGARILPAAHGDGFTLHVLSRPCPGGRPVGEPAQHCAR